MSQDALDLIEQAARQCAPTIDQAYEISIAISLKRIADALEKPNVEIDPQLIRENNAAVEQFMRERGTKP